MKFKKDFVAQMVRDVGTIAVDTFVSQLDAFCDEVVPLKPNSSKIDVSLLRFIANVIENAFVKRDVIDDKVSKKELCLNEYIRMKQRMGINLTEEEVKVLEDLLEDLHSAGEIKKRSFFKYLLKKVKKILA